MPADLVLRDPAPAPVPVLVPGAGTIIARRTARRALRSSAAWGYVFGLYVASTALGYSATYKTPAQRHQLAILFGSNGGASALAGPGYQLQTVAGFTVWKSLLTLCLIGAVWGFLTATRLLRGEEDAGRWELMLCGQTTRGRAAAQAMIGLGAGFLVFLTLTAAIIVGAGRASSVQFGVGASLFFALALASGAAMFFAVGALASQLAPTRRRAASYCAVALGAAYAVRMIADSAAGLAWIRWASPLGWVEELQPLTSPHLVALLPIAGLIAAAGVLTVALAGSRDLGASTIPDRASGAARTGLLAGPTGLALRLARPAFIGWGVAIALGCVLLGLIAESGGRALSGSPSIEHVTARLGLPGSGAAAYIGFIFLIVAVLLTLISAGQISAARAEEAEGRLDQLLVRPVRRSAWLAGRLGATAAMLVAAGLIAGFGCWLGAVGQDSGVGLPTMLAAGLNLVPPAVLVLGVGALALGVWPRAATSAAYAAVLWSLLVYFIGGAVTVSHWLLDTSVFHQLAPAPAVDPNPVTSAVLTAIGVAAAALGLLAFRHRDLAGE